MAGIENNWWFVPSVDRVERFINCISRAEHGFVASALLFIRLDDDVDGAPPNGGTRI